MSLSIDKKDGVKINSTRKRGLGIAALIVALEAAFSFFLYLSLAAKIFAPIPVESAKGVPNLISYQGLLTDSSGNPLGGAGTIYCFRYSIYDASTTGNQLWPSGNASSSNSTTTVTDGVFSDQLGRTDSLSSLDFTSTSTYYLQVQVNTVTSTCAGTWEYLTPRQQITSDAWAQTAASVYGNALRIATSTKVQIGTAGGSSTSTITYLSLDIDNQADETIGSSCSNNGSLWYDSTYARAMVCENSLVQPISNGSTTIAGIGTNATAPITAGSVVFSNSNNVSFGQNGSTITASAGGATLSYYQNLPAIINTSLVNISGSSIWVAPFNVPQTISASYLRIPVSIANNSATATWASTSVATSFSGARYETDVFVIYSQGVGANSQSLQSLLSSSAGWTMQTIVSQTAGGTAYTVTYNVTYPITGNTNNYTTSFTSNVSNSSYNILATYTLFTGPRRMDIPFAGSLSAGNYWIALGRSTNTGFNGPSTLSSASLGLSFIGVSQLAQSFGNFGVATNTSIQIMPGLGYWTTNSFELSTASMAISNISAVASNATPFFEIIKSN